MTSCPPDFGGRLILRAQPGVLQKLVVAVPAVRGWHLQRSPDADGLVPQTWQRLDLVR